MNTIQSIGQNTYDVLTQVGIEVNPIKVEIHTKYFYDKSMKINPHNPYNSIKPIVGSLIRGEYFIGEISTLEEEVHSRCLHDEFPDTDLILDDEVDLDSLLD